MVGVEAKLLIFSLGFEVSIQGGNPRTGHAVLSTCKINYKNNYFIYIYIYIYTYTWEWEHSKYEYDPRKQLSHASFLGIAP
jgi:hypothetical protein